MTQTTSKKSFSSTGTQFDNIEHIRKLELENRKLKQQIAEQEAAMSDLTEQDAAMSDLTSDSGVHSIDRESLWSLGSQLQHEEERRLSELDSELNELTLDSELTPSNGINCVVCGKILKNRHALAIHIGRMHNKL